MTPTHILMRFLATLFALATFANAQRTSSIATLTPDVTSVAPGEPFTVALQLKHPVGWHSYYKNSGGLELPPEIKWTLPEGAKAGEIQWPTPTVKEGYAGKSFIYPGSPVFLIRITPPPSLPVGSTFTFTASAQWQICDTQCIDESEDFSIELPVTETATADNAASIIFVKAKTQIPQQPGDAFEALISLPAENKDSINIEFRGISEEPTEFIPNQTYLRTISDGGVVSKTDDGYLVTLQRKKTDFLDNPIPQGNTVSGILIAGKSYLIPEASAPTEAPTTPQPASARSFILTLAGMFFGGLLLNLMPCVFPVIGLKIMGFVQQAGKNRRSIAMHGFAFCRRRPCLLRHSQRNSLHPQGIHWLGLPTPESMGHPRPTHPHVHPRTEHVRPLRNRHIRHIRRREPPE